MQQLVYALNFSLEKYIVFFYRLVVVSKFITKIQLFDVNLNYGVSLFTAVVMVSFSSLTLWRCCPCTPPRSFNSLLQSPNLLRSVLLQFLGQFHRITSTKQCHSKHSNRAELSIMVSFFFTHYLMLMRYTVQWACFTGSRFLVLRKTCHLVKKYN